MAYTDSAVAPGVTYFYEVEAVGPAGSSGPSNEASATPLLATTLRVGLGQRRGVQFR